MVRPADEVIAQDDGLNLISRLGLWSCLEPGRVAGVLGLQGETGLTCCLFGLLNQRSAKSRRGLALGRLGHQELRWLLLFYTLWSRLLLGGIFIAKVEG